MKATRRYVIYYYYPLIHFSKFEKVQSLSCDYERHFHKFLNLHIFYFSLFILIILTLKSLTQDFEECRSTRTSNNPLKLTILTRQFCVINSDYVCEYCVVNVVYISVVIIIITQQ